MACIYYYFFCLFVSFSQRIFSLSLTGNCTSSCVGVCVRGRVHECVFVPCWRRLPESKKKTKNGETDLFTQSETRLSVKWRLGRRKEEEEQISCWTARSDFSDFIFVLVHLNIISCSRNIHPGSHISVVV